MNEETFNIELTETELRRIRGGLLSDALKTLQVKHAVEHGTRKHRRATITHRKTMDLYYKIVNAMGD